MKVPQFEPYLGMEEYKAIKDCFDKNWITEGPKAEEFNKRLCKFINAKYAVFAPNGTLALCLGLMAIGIGKDDEVIVPDFTFIASANAVEIVGAKPIFADVNRKDFQISIEDCKRVVSDKTKAIMPVHIYGLAANMDEVMQFAQENNLMLIEDAAQALGIRWKDKYCGTFGHVGCFSFFADKTITTGEGGLVVTNDENIYNNLIMLRNQGRKKRGTFIHPEIGYNFRMTDIQMAIGIIQLNKFKHIANKKLHIYNKYRNQLKTVEEISFIKIDNRSDFIPFRIAIICKKAHELMNYLNSKGIQPRTFFYPLHRQPCYQYLKYKQEWWRRLDDKNFPNAIFGYENGVCLPSFPRLTDEQIKYVCDSIKEFYKTNGE